MTVETTYKGVRYAAVATWATGQNGWILIQNHSTGWEVYTEWRRRGLHFDQLVRNAEVRRVIPKRALSRLEKKLRAAQRAETSEFMLWMRDTVSYAELANGVRSDLADAERRRIAAGALPEGFANWGEAAGYPPRVTVVRGSSMGSSIPPGLARVPDYSDAERRVIAAGAQLGGQSAAALIAAGAFTWSEAGADPLQDIEDLARQIREDASPWCFDAEEAANFVAAWRRTSYHQTAAEGSPAYMQAMVRQVSDETVELWCAAWCMPEDSTRADLLIRVLDEGPGDLVPEDEAADLARRIVADVGQQNIDGARRADRTEYARHHDPDTTEDLDHFFEDGAELEPLEDVEWLRDILTESEKTE